MRHIPSGFTLLEVLVSIVILSIGLLGMAGLMAMGLKSNHIASYRSQATFLADDILDRMRANKTLALASQYDKALAGSCPAAVGTIQGYDCNEWKTMVANELPGGQSSVSVDLNGNVTVVIQWQSGLDENNDGTVDSSDVLNFTTKTRL